MMMEAPPFEKTQIAQGVEQNAGLGPNEVPATPEQQKLYEQFVVGGMQLLHGEATRDQMIEQMRAEPGPDGVARALVMVVNHLESAMERAGHELPEELKWQGGRELMEQLLEVADAAGTLGDEEIDADLVERTLIRTVDLYLGREAQSGDLDMSWLEDYDPEAAEAARELGFAPGEGEMPPEEMPPEEMPPEESGLLNGAMGQ